MVTIPQDAASVGSKIKSAINYSVSEVSSCVTDGLNLLHSAVSDKLKDFITG
jgi:hypothetical protein